MRINDPQRISEIPKNIRVKFKKNGAREFFKLVNTKTGNNCWKELYNFIDANKSTFSDWLNGKSSIPLRVALTCMQISNIKFSEIDNIRASILDSEIIQCKNIKNSKYCTKNLSDILPNLKDCKRKDDFKHLFNNSTSLDIKNKELTQLIAMLITDGGISVYRDNGTHYEIYFTQKFQQPVVLFSKLLQQVFGIRANIRKRQKGNSKFYSGSVYSKLAVKELFKVLGIEQEFTGNKRIPNFIIRDRDLGKEFLRVLYGAEGCIYKRNKKVIIEIACKSEALQEDIMNLLRSQNIDAKTYKTKITIIRKFSVKRFIQNIGTLECFRVVRGKYCGHKKTTIFKSMLSFLQNSSS